LAPLPSVPTRRSSDLPRTCRVPEAVAIGTVRIAERVDDARRVGLAVANPGGCLEIGPYLVADRLEREFLELVGIGFRAGCVDARADDRAALRPAVGGDGLRVGHRRERAQIRWAGELLQ